MTDPYRDRRLACPACNAPLREYQTRWVCDACDGMMLALPDLAVAIFDMTSVQPVFEYRDEKPGKRACPHCHTQMTTCKLRVVIEDELAEPRPVLDRCAEHGIWFDGEELANVFLKCAGKGHGNAHPHRGGVNATRGSGGWRGASGVPEWWGGGGGGKW